MMDFLLAQKAFVKTREVEFLTSEAQKQLLPTQLIKELRLVQRIDYLLSALTSHILLLYKAQASSHKGCAYAPENYQGLQAVAEGFEVYLKLVQEALELSQALPVEPEGQDSVSEGGLYPS